MVGGQDANSRRIEADNANREKKIAQLQEFIAHFSAGTRSAQATSRKKEVDACKRRSWRGATSSGRTLNSI